MSVFTPKSPQSSPSSSFYPAHYQQHQQQAYPSSAQYYKFIAIAYVDHKNLQTKREFRFHRRGLIASPGKQIIGLALQDERNGFGEQLNAVQDDEHTVARSSIQRANW